MQAGEFDTGWMIVGVLRATSCDDFGRHIDWRELAER
jgi:hypothetical protein